MIRSVIIRNLFILVSVSPTSTLQKNKCKNSVLNKILGNTAPIHLRIIKSYEIHKTDQNCIVLRHKIQLFNLYKIKMRYVYM